MNAGAYDHEIGERVAWIRVAGADGVRTLSGDELEWCYRESPGLAGLVVVAAGLLLRNVAQSEIASVRNEIRSKRLWQKGLRCAGSVFRNPPGAFAGEIIEKAGLKGCRIGGARVCSEHANFIVAELGALASDVLALMRHVEDEVLRQFGVHLQREVKVWGR
jgi:UDP-N-acetylmuramate dehydrogenase